MNDGQGGPGYTIDAEFNNKFIHKKGALSAARTGDVQNPEKKSSGSQFYIVQGRQVSSIELDQIMAQRNEMVRQEMIRDYVQATDQAELLETITGYIQNQQMNLVDSIITSITPMATEGFVPSTYTDEQRASYAELGGTPFLDGNYTIFGEVIRGLAVIDSVIVQNTNEMDRPLENITMTVTVETMNKTYIQNEYGYIYEQ
jgi:cyclophilin family peptidyl-prolyl cis-trans isomerase